MAPVAYRRLPWWEQIGIVYSKSSELRAMFIETLNRVTQGLSQHPTLKLMPSLPNLKDKALGKGNKYSATEDEKLPKTLLLCIVRLIHAGNSHQPSILTFNIHISLPNTYNKA